MPEDASEKNAELAFRRWMDGDESAFREVMTAYFTGLTYFANGFVHDVHTAEDVAIETMTELVVHPSRFGFRSSLRTYLYAVARHKALNLVRRRKRIAFVPLDDNARDEASLEDEVLENSGKKALAAALDKLREPMRSAVHLVYIEGMSYDEAAKVLGKNRKQVDNLIARAKNELKNKLEVKPRTNRSTPPMSRQGAPKARRARRTTALRAKLNLFSGSAARRSLRAAGMSRTSPSAAQRRTAACSSCAKGSF